MDSVTGTRQHRRSQLRSEIGKLNREFVAASSRTHRAAQRAAVRGYAAETRRVQKTIVARYMEQSDSVADNVLHAVGTVLAQADGKWDMTGSCFLFRSDVVALTAAHCVPVEGEPSAVHLPHLGRTLPVERVERHPTADIAILFCIGEDSRRENGFPTIAFWDGLPSGNYGLGEGFFAYGYPSEGPTEVSSDAPFAPPRNMAWLAKTPFGQGVSRFQGSLSSRRSRRSLCATLVRIGSGEVDVSNAAGQRARSAGKRMMRKILITAVCLAALTACHSAAPVPTGSLVTPSASRSTSWPTTSSPVPTVITPPPGAHRSSIVNVFVPPGASLAPEDSTAEGERWELNGTSYSDAVSQEEALLPVVSL